MGRCGDLYERVKQLEGEWLGQEIQKRITTSITSSLLLAKEPVDVQDQSNERRAAGERFLSVLREAWEDHQLCMGMITDVLMYMVGYNVAALFCYMSRLTYVFF
jgi:cullin 3